MADGIGIGPLSRRLKCTLRALRFYEEEKLLFPERRGDRRLYSEREAEFAGLIVKWRNAGFRIPQIRILRAEWRDGQPIDHIVEAVADDRLKEIDLELQAVMELYKK